MSEIKKLNLEQIGNPDNVTIVGNLKDHLGRFIGNVKLENIEKNSDKKKDYVVIVKEGFTIDSLEFDLERDTTHDHTVDSNIVPDREVEVANRRPGSERQTHYWLTDEEATKLKNHHMVLNVEWNPKEDPSIKIKLSAKVNQNFERAGLFGSSTGNRVNFGLYRCTQKTNTYGVGKTKQADYNYILDGSGVDVIIMDNGIFPTHPEWQDKNGTSRLQQINWYTAAGISGTMPANFYNILPGDDGHGTHTAGIVAGKTYGWAKNARIYSMNILGEDPIDILEAFDLMKLFHRNKPIDPLTGQKRPTVVNASWATTRNIISSPAPYDPYNEIGLVYLNLQIWGGSYRGNTWSGYTVHPEYALQGTALGTIDVGSGITSTVYSINGYSSAYDAALQELINEGVHFIKASGNDNCKQELSTGADYNNTVKIISDIDINGQPVLDSYYYNRPGSPWAENCIVVGSIGALAYNSTLEAKSFYSNFGTAVDIYAPGTGIVSSYTAAAGSPYYFDNNYRQYNDSGTSMAAPQAAGVIALFAQLSPGISPIEAKKWLIKNAISNALFSTGLDDDYLNVYSLSGGPNKFLYNPYAVASVGPTNNSSIIIKNCVVKLKS